MSGLADAVDALDAADREAVETLLYRLADDELVCGERYTEWQVRAPTLESDISVSNVAQDEFGHARLWYDVLRAFGHTEPELIWERDPGEFRHATLVERPFEDGAWADCVVRSYLYDETEAVRLDALEDSAFAPVRDRVEKIRGEEEYHREHARSWLERLTESEDGRERCQRALDRLYPHALTLFAPVDPEVERRIESEGFRTATLDELREDWTARTTPFLDALGLAVPTDATLPEAVGRDGTHTDAWARLHDEMTATYSDLDRSETVEIRGEEA